MIVAFDLFKKHSIILTSQSRSSVKNTLTIFNLFKTLRYITNHLLFVEYTMPCAYLLLLIVFLPGVAQQIL